MPQTGVVGISVDRAAINMTTGQQLRQELPGMSFWVELEGLSHIEQAAAVTEALGQRAGVDVIVIPTDPGTQVWVPLGLRNEIVDVLGGALEAAGHSGRVSAVSAPSSITVPYVAGPALFMAHAIDPPILQGTFNAFGAPKPRWDVPGDAEERLLGAATAWLTESPVVFGGSVDCTPVGAHSGVDVLRTMIVERRRFQAIALTHPPVNCFVDRRDPVTHVVAFDTFGMTVWTDLRERPMIERVRAHEARLRSFAADLEIGFIDLARPVGHEVLDLTSGIMGVNLHLWDSWVGDAHAIQLLSGAHLERARDLTAWDVEEVAWDRWLLRARDLDPWFAAEVPAEVRDQARHDFGDMILTQEVAAQHPPPPPPPSA